MHNLEDKNIVLYTGALHPRKDLQLLCGNVIKAPTKTQKEHYAQDKVDTMIQIFQI